MTDCVLVLNAGSSSFKFAVYRRAARPSWEVATRGQIDGIGVSPRMSARDGAGQVMVTAEPDADTREASTALDHLPSHPKLRASA